MKKKDLIQEVNGLESLCFQVAQSLWDHPELSGREERSAGYLRTILEEEGFRIVNHDDMPHAFYAEFGTGQPVVAVLGEYDALPRLSQTVSVKQEPVETGGPGHGCGHNLLGAGSITAAIAIKRYLEKTDTPGTVRFYGCPEEETLGGKVEMSHLGLFEGADIALSWHPMSVNMTLGKSYLAISSARFHFEGITSHAAFAPERGRSALDAVELMHVGVNYLREHVGEHTRMHYAPEAVDYPANIVPARAGTLQMIRAPRMEEVLETIERVHKIARGAAMMTETAVEMTTGYGRYEMKENVRFADLTYENLRQAQAPCYTEEEMEFAEELQATLPEEARTADAATYETRGVFHKGIVDKDLWRELPIRASSDSGDVSQQMPMNLFSIACWPLGVAPHTWQATAAAGSTLGQKGALYAARVLALCAYDLYNDPKALQEIQEEFDRRTEKPYVPIRPKNQ